MTKSRFWHTLFLSLAGLVVISVPGLCTTITVSSALNPNPVLLPDQTLSYLGNNSQNVIVGSGPFSLGAFESVLGTNPSPVTTFTLSITDSVDSNVLVFHGTFAIVGGNDTITFTGTGTETIGGLSYATITDAGFIYGIQQLNTPPNVVNPGKGTVVIGSIVSAVPEPAACLMCGLGLVALAGAIRKRLNR